MRDKIDFRVKLGDLVQLQFIPEDGRDRLNAKIIGHAPNKSLIISAPSVGGKLPILKENQPFVVRMLQGSRVYGFQSVVLKYYTLPYPHLHLKQPENIECIQVRGAQRVNTSLVISVHTADDKTFSVTMLNTSASGGLLQAREVLGKLNDRVSISLELNISGIQKYLR
ncbi:MAG TPA: flagellar brake protein, partial [Gammaproteobacteria bacterium]